MKAYISTGLVAETLLAMVRIQSLKCTHLDKLSSGRITYGIPTVLGLRMRYHLPRNLDG